MSVSLLVQISCNILIDYYYVPHYFMHGGQIWLPANVQIRVCIYIGHVTYNIALTVHSPIYVITTQA